MTLTGEFRISVSEFPLEETLTSVPGSRVRLVRVTMAPEVLSPFFWVTAGDLEAVDEALASDPSVAEAVRLDGFEERALYRVEWTPETEAFASAVADVDGSVLRTVATDAGWDCRVRFPDHTALTDFRTQLDEGDVTFETQKLGTDGQLPGGALYGLTDKQAVAIRRAWELGYYETPHTTTLADVASDLEISQQALSDRLRRGHANLLSHTVVETTGLDPGTTDGSI
jgi:predicted DNA binding protein